ncbi:MAG: hypothetical protein LBI91_04160 [Spirochaetaceae bacterium]|jgi:hypothetical protein|nr:hypothetical protein [Spirochaetaceae bacterium]
MENEKNPSIYDDRSAIGSSEELDEYGVWVKSGPQDISEKFQSASGDEDDGVSLDLSRDFSFSAKGELPDFEDFPGSEDAGESGGDGLNFESPENDGVFDNDVDFETIEDGGAGEEDQFVDIDIPADTETGETPGFEPLGGQEAGAPDPSDSAENAPEGGAEICFEEISPGEDEDLNFEDIADNFPEETAGQAAPPESVNDFEISFGDSADFPEIPGEEPRENSRAAEESQGETAEAGGGGDSKVSTQLLLQIVNELSSIKSELASLKKEIAAARGGIPQGEPAGQAPGGFFDEADDEKIALTGAEMDNIINTASFTEEAGSGGDDGAGIAEAEALDAALPAAGDVEIGGDESGGAAEASPFEEAGPDGDIPGLPEDFAAGLSADLPAEFSIDDSEIPAPAEEYLSVESAAPVPDSGELPPELLDDTADIPDMTEEPAGTEILTEDTGLPPGDGIEPDSETSDLDLDANLSLDFPFENEDENAVPPDTSADDSFAQLIPEGYEEKAPELPARAGDSLEEEDIFDAAILPEDDILDAGLAGGDISTGAGESIDTDSVFDLSPEPDEGAPAGDIEIPEISLDLDAEFDTAVPALEEDITIDIPADTESGESAGEEPSDFDFAEVPLEQLDEESLDIEDLSPAEQDAAEEEALPDIVLEEEPAIELLPEDESLSTDFGDFSIETPEEIPDTEIQAEPVPEDILDAGIQAEPAPETAFELPPEDEPFSMDFGDFSIEAGEDILNAEIPAEPAPGAAIELSPEDESLSAELDDFSLEALEDISDAEIRDEPVPEPAAGLPPEDESLSADDFGDFSIETPEDISNEELPVEPAPEPAVELPLEDESLSAEFDEFSIETPEDISDEEVPAEPAPQAAGPAVAETGVPAGSVLANVPEKLREELKSVLSYMDQLLESLPEEKIEEFAKSEYFDTYKKLFEDLGLV